MHTRMLPLTRLLLLCGAIAGPLFIFVLLVQDYTRPGFDPRLDLLSLLSLGDWGWVQIVNFILAGLLNLLYAVGLWRRLHPGRGGTWGPILIAVYGFGLVLVGIFRTDPANGFPPGVPAATHPSWHGAIHALGALFVFLMLAAALLVFVWLFLTWKERWWAVYCLEHGKKMLYTSGCFNYGDHGDEWITEQTPLHPSPLGEWIRTALWTINALLRMDGCDGSAHC